MATRKKILQVAVIGLGRFGNSVAKTLIDLGCEVLAIDANMKKVEAIADYVTHAVQAEATDEATLKNLGLSNYDVVVIAVGTNIQASILATLIIKEMGVENIVAKASSSLHQKALKKIGASRVIYPEQESGKKLAYSLMSINLVEYLEITPDYQIAEVIIQGAFDGKTLEEANLSNRFGINVLAIREGEALNVTPKGDDVLKKGDMLVILGKTKDLQNFCENC